MKPILNIEINMDTPCKKCGKKGATQNGYCLKCIGDIMLEKKMIVEGYFDGCCEPTNPGGTAAYGIVILRNGRPIHYGNKMFPAGPRTSNNVAEYSGFIARP